MLIILLFFLLQLSFGFSFNTHYFGINPIDKVTIAPSKQIINILPSVFIACRCASEKSGKSDTTVINKKDPNNIENKDNSELSTKENSSTVTASGDIMDSPAFLSRKVEILKSDIMELDLKLNETEKIYEKCKSEWGPRINGIEKEYNTIQQRMKTQGKDLKTKSIITMARNILNVLDNFSRAFEVVKPSNDKEKTVENEYKEANNMILKLFEDNGIIPIESVGKEFDYKLHQAVKTEFSDEYDEGIICAELSKGYKMKEGNELIRESMVIVSS